MSDIPIAEAMKVNIKLLGKIQQLQQQLAEANEVISQIASGGRGYRNGDINHSKNNLTASELVAIVRAYLQKYKV